MIFADGDVYQNPVQVIAAAGVLKEIKVKEGATVQVNTVVGVIDAEGGAAKASAPAPAQSKAAPAQPAPSQSASAASSQADGAAAAQQPPATEKSAPVQEERGSAAAGANGGAGIDVALCDPEREVRVGGTQSGYQRGNSSAVLNKTVPQVVEP